MPMPESGLGGGVPMTAAVIMRFLDKTHVLPGTGCWRWTAARDDKGYGRFRSAVGSLAHRFASCSQR